MTLPDVPPFQLALHERDDRYVSTDIARTGRWEPLETEIVCRLLPHFSTFIDLGANIGWYAVVAGLRLRGRGTVHAFEPATCNWRLLEHNVEVNGLDNVVLHRVAVGNRNGTADLHIAGDNQGDHSLHGSGETRPSEQVPLVTLDEFLSLPPSSSFLLKADTQGAEPAILAGARRLLERHRDSALILEFWPFGVMAAGWPVTGYLDAIEALGREVFVIDETEGCLWRSSVDALAKAVESDLRPEGRAFCNLALLPSSIAREPGIEGLVHR